ncbi:helix-turn-helix domain-containing protein [Nocardia sp. NPDC059240]|uniref:helix-turn-helix domain-containing protein n=1 Tax=Nocardia sp. NPDC059240 TaxID=3346786 RepID=UPI003699A3E5
MTETRTDNRTFALEIAADRIGASRDWVMRQLRTGRFPGRKVGRDWRMTESDILASIEIVARPARSTDMSGLTARSSNHTITTEPTGLADLAAGLTSTSRRRLTARI